jgi:diguanylate cyclase (GGDEF)-like protein
MLGSKPLAESAEAGTPVSIEAALRRVRMLAGALILVRLLTTSTLPNVIAVLLVVAFWLINVISYVAQRETPRRRAILGVVQLLADTVVVLLVVWAQHGRTSADSADWAVLVLPVIEGAIRFQIPGAIASWLVLAAGYVGWNLTSEPSLPMSTLAQRLTVVFLVALPSGFLAEHLVAEIAAHRREKEEAERRSALLRAAALGGQRSTKLDVDEILEVLRNTVADMGFADPQVFELFGSDTPALTARPVRQSRDVLAIPPGDPRLLAAAAARTSGKPTIWPPSATYGGDRRRDRRRGGDPAPNAVSVLFALPITAVEDAFVVVTARWPGPGAPPASQTESLELFAAQAGASLRNAQVHRELAALKDRLAHEASHDALTELPNRRRFTEQLERMCGRGRPGDLISVLFLDLDGFKDVNDRFGHDVGNDLLVAVAARLRSCVRPGDVVARMGGDEFTIMLTRLESVAPAVEVAERICAMLTDPLQIRTHEVRISTSIGISVAAAENADPGDLLRRADVAMYRAKSQGKAGWAMDPSSLEPAGNGSGE